MSKRQRRGGQEVFEFQLCWKVEVAGIDLMKLVVAKLMWEGAVRMEDVRLEIRKDRKHTKICLERRQYGQR